MDFADEGLLDGLSGDEREARLELLERLASEGVGLDELKAAVDEDRLVLLPVELELGGEHTAREIADASGVPVDLPVKIRRALGFPAVEPDEPAWSDEDVAAMRSVKQFLDAGIPEEAVIEITRVLGEGMSRLAPTMTGAFADTYLKPGDTEHDVALRYAAMAKALLPSMSPVLSAALAAYVRESARRGIIGRSELELGQLTGEEQAVVCFADLVGFTSLGGEIGVQELGSVARGLAELASEVAKPPVRLVKTIGDAAMFVSPEAGPLVAVALDLVDAMEKADLPSVRAGIASGPVVTRAGDWYGPAVNLSSRVTGVARPASVLCTKEVRDAAPDDFNWSTAGRFRLKGVSGHQPLYRPRRLEGEPATKPTRGRRRK